MLVATTAAVAQHEAGATRTHRIMHVLAHSHYSARPAGRPTPNLMRTRTRRRLYARARIAQISAPLMSGIAK